PAPTATAAHPPTATPARATSQRAGPASLFLLPLKAVRAPSPRAGDHAPPTQSSPSRAHVPPPPSTTASLFAAAVRSPTRPPRAQRPTATTYPRLQDAPRS